MTQGDAGERWAKKLHQRVGASIRQARAGRGMSAQQVADKTASLGYPVTRSQIANYESGRKQSLDIAELLVIAATLEVPPVSLLFGGHPDRDVEVLPGRTMQTIAALARFSGDDSYESNVIARESIPDSPPALLLALARERASVERELAAATAVFELVGKRDDDAHQIAHIAELTDRIARINQLIQVTADEWSSDE
ncbi:helix-turn-helix domain-containing protein [Mycolicibacterium sp. 3033]|nr:helix-turn-helix domain-containing protein [Mycolicibacterium aurantiacum]